MSVILRTRDVMLHAAMETLMWSSLTDEGENLDDLYDVEHIAQSTIDELRTDVTEFIDGIIDNGDDHTWHLIESNPEKAGHDFILSRNGHGAGFWDRGYGESGDVLHKWAKTFGAINLYVGDDGRLYN